ncbi:mitochondrial carrier [Jaminaea rosea]|uniref:Mitochondrial carrier n=1 Tax=Jaminaea rosea TaxID=1569628 RepID=A0A316V159_9BASI|nr:mitochondrial carrier [Jaminaea rosea]PWN30738.1 mitochondrial carrier [Jaminaea rosea]
MASDVSSSPSAIVDFLAGTAGGAASVLVGQPFDTIKTRLQAQHARPTTTAAAVTSPSVTTPLISSAPTYRSAMDAYRIIVRDERFFGLFKGVASPMLGVAAMNACIFGSYGLALRTLQSSSAPATSSPSASSPLLLSHVFLAGAASGLASALITSPVELVKIREQLDYSGQGAKPHPLRVAKALWTSGGLRALYRGLGATCLRDVGYGPYFLCYEVFNRLLLSTHDATPLPGGEAPQLSNVELAFSGALAGVVAWVSTFPIDCIKTRVQATDHRTGVVAAARSIWREGGWRAFWHGVGPTVLRAIPVNATLFVVYEATKGSLAKWGW